MGPNPVWLVSLQEEEIMAQTRPVGRHRKKTAIWKLRRAASEETNPGFTLILDLEPPELWENKFA